MIHIPGVLGIGHGVSLSSMDDPILVALMVICSASGFRGHSTTIAAMTNRHIDVKFRHITHEAQHRCLCADINSALGGEFEAIHIGDIIRVTWLNN